MTIEELLHHFDNATRAGDNQWSARCPAHEDQRNSLCISAADDGKLLLHCQAGCDTTVVLAAKGLALKNLFPSTNGNGRHGGSKRIVAKYDYQDESGELVFQVCRFEPKDFRQRSPLADGAWSWSVKGTKIVPFRLPELLAKPTELVFACEGERDVLAINQIGLLATCNAGGALKWKSDHAKFFTGRDVVILPDNDSPGRQHGEQVARSLVGIAKSIKVVELPGLKEKGDVSDWIAGGGTKEQLMALVAATAEWKPEPKPEKTASKATAAPTRESAEELLASMPEAARTDAQAMLQSESLLQMVIDDVASMGVAGERELVASIYLVGVSRLLARPLAAIVQAPSSTGKSFVLEKTTKLFPPETTICATSLTPQSLFYLKPGSLVHKFIVAGERSRIEGDEAAESTRALREMISGGRLSKLVPVKEAGGMATKLIVQEGPIAFVESTTATAIFDEDANRCLMLAADERREQTVEVIARLAASYTGAIAPDVESVVNRHHAAQRMLQGKSVVIPFADQIASRFDSERVEARRAFPHLMSMVSASALLHQFQRRTDGADRLIASIDDYMVARHLCLGPLSRLLGSKISAACLRFYDRLRGWAEGEFTTSEAARRDRRAGKSIRGWLLELAEAGGVEQIEPSKGSKPATWKFIQIDPKDLAIGDCGLPNPEEIKE
jgi:hypothetical protein